MATRRDGRIICAMCFTAFFCVSTFLLLDLHRPQTPSAIAISPTTSIDTGQDSLTEFAISHDENQKLLTEIAGMYNPVLPLLGWSMSATKIQEQLALMRKTADLTQKALDFKDLICMQQSEAHLQESLQLCDVIRANLQANKARILLFNSLCFYTLTVLAHGLLSLAHVYMQARMIDQHSLLPQPYCHALDYSLLNIPLRLHRRQHPKGKVVRDGPGLLHTAPAGGLALRTHRLLEAICSGRRWAHL